MNISTTTHRPETTRGFTLVELLMAVSLSSFVLAGVLTTNLHLVRGGIRITQYAEMDSQVRRGYEQLGHDLKIASAITWNGTSDITLTIPNSSGATTQVTYAWTSGTQSLFKVPGASSAVTVGRVYLVQGILPLAGGAPGLTFARFDRNGVAATTDLATKRIQVRMTVSRQSGTAATATANAVSVTFILRNKLVG